MQDPDLYLYLYPPIQRQAHSAKGQHSTGELKGRSGLQKESWSYCRGRAKRAGEMEGGFFDGPPRR